MITRRDVSVLGGMVLLVAHRLSRAQPGTALRRVGLLTLSSVSDSGGTYAAFKQGMHDLGWLEGKNVEYEYVHAQGEASRLDALASELVAREVDLILAGSAVATRAAQRATKTIPIVMAFSVDAVGNGLVASLARPGGNTTGLSNQLEDVFAKLIEMLHAVAPGARRIAVLLNESNPSHSKYWATALSACAALKLEALRVVASSPAQLAQAVEQIVRLRAQAVVVHGDPLFRGASVRLQEFLQPTRLPAAFGLRDHVAAGGLLSYGPDIAASYRYSAKYVDKILKGAKPANLPVEQPTRFELVINMKTARALGITIPYSVTLRATEVIE